MPRKIQILIINEMEADSFSQCFAEGAFSASIQAAYLNAYSHTITPSNSYLSAFTIILSIAVPVRIMLLGALISPESTGFLQVQLYRLKNMKSIRLQTAVGTA
jgi:hypothetical protein